jgi:DNA-binding GntR family transcriptional regulator
MHTLCKMASNPERRVTSTSDGGRRRRSSRTSPLTPQRPLVQNAAVTAADAIRQAILEGRLHPGERLKEEELSEDLSISRTPIREALLILQTEGILEALPRRGSLVRSYRPDEIVDLYETRAVLEAHAASRAARNIDGPTIARMRKSCTRFEGLTADREPHRLVRENMIFHTLILDAAQSPTVTSLVAIVAKLPLIYRSYYWLTPEGRTIALHYHTQITNALEARDAGRAESLMREHILEARDLLFAHLSELEAKSSPADAVAPGHDANLT